jgi:hypothetical protein
MAWATKDEVRAFIRSLLAQRDEPQEHWDQAISTGIDTARTWITDAILMRGYSVAQLTAWDSLHSFHLDLSAFAALTRGGILAPGFPVDRIDRLDRRSELSKTVILAGGEVVIPSGPFGVARTRPHSEDQDLVRLDPNDPRIGKVTVL